MQGAGVLYNPAYAPNGSHFQGHTQVFTPHRTFDFPWTAGGSSDALAPCGRSYTPYAGLVLRPPSSLEPTPDLKDPHFSCGVPLLVYHDYPFNYAHTFAHTATWLHRWLHVERLSFRDRAQLVFPMPHGLGLRPFYAEMMQPFSRGAPIKTLAE